MRRGTALPCPYNAVPSRVSHAEGGTRTPTGLRPLRPERSASTNSTTSARWNGEYRPRYNLKSTLGLTAPNAVSILALPGGQSHNRAQPAGASRLPSPGNVGGRARTYGLGGQVAAGRQGESRRSVRACAQR